MTKDQIDTVLDRVHTWPQARQEDAVRLLLAMEADGTTTYALTPDERADLEAALLEAAAGDFSTEAEVRAALMRRRG